MTRHDEPMRWRDDPAAAPSGAAEALRSYAEQRATGDERRQLQERLASLLNASAPASPSTAAGRSALLKIGFVAVGAALLWTLLDANKTHKTTPPAQGSAQPAAALAVSRKVGADLEPTAQQPQSLQNSSHSSDAQSEQRAAHAAIPERNAAALPALPMRKRAIAQPQGNAADHALSPQRELELLRRAQEALPRTPQVAEALLAEHMRDYPHGIFEQEREMLRIEVALARAERSQARELARSFLTRFAGSTYQRQLEAMLAPDSAREKSSDADTQSMGTNKEQTMLRIACVEVSVRGCVSRVLLAFGLIAAVGCDSVTNVGSGCKDGVCPLAAGTDSCLARATSRTVAVMGTPESGNHFNGVCWPSHLPRDTQGLVAARVRWILPLEHDAKPDTPTHCSERPYLHDLDVASNARYRTLYRGRQICDVDQLPVLEAGVVPSGIGFYYDDFSSELQDVCLRGSPGRIRFTDTPADGVIVDMISDEMLGADGEPATGRICRAEGDADVTGKRCMPPLESYDQSQAVLRRDPGLQRWTVHRVPSRSQRCRRLRAQPVPLCAASDAQCVQRQPCASQAELAKFIFCSCRCDAPEPDAELCPCRDGFVCTPIIDQGDPDLVGSYCVPKNIVASI